MQKQQQQQQLQQQQQQQQQQLQIRAKQQATKVQHIIQTPNQLNKQTIIKPNAAETNIHKIVAQKVPSQPSLMTNTSQPLKLLSSLTSMVNSSNTSRAGLTINKNSLIPGSRTPKSTLINTTTTSAPTSIQPILMQLAAQQQKNKESLTRDQILEFQKTYAKQLAAAGVKITSSTVPNAVQLGSTALTINTKIPIQTIQSSSAGKSAFAISSKLKSNKLPTGSTTSSNLLNLTQAQVSQLAQQGLILSPKPQQQHHIKAAQSASNTTHKILHDQLKGLSPIQRELLIKQYSAAAVGKQPMLASNAANPAILASILKNRQSVPTAILSPKGVIGGPATPSSTTTALKKGPKVSVFH